MLCSDRCTGRATVTATVSPPWAPPAPPLHYVTLWLCPSCPPLPPNLSRRGVTSFQTAQTLLRPGSLTPHNSLKMTDKLWHRISETKLNLPWFLASARLHQRSTSALKGTEQLFTVSRRLQRREYRHHQAERGTAGLFTSININGQI